MPARLSAAIPSLALPRSRWVQGLCCAVLALSAIRGPQTLFGIAGEPGAAATNVPPTILSEADFSTRATIATATLGLTSIEVMVGKHDTMDQIFRRLQLSLADLASLRSLPDIRARLDRLYPGELLRVRHRDGEVIELSKRLSPSETFTVVRHADGFASDVIRRPVEVRPLTTHGVISSSLFQATEDAGISDATALQLAEIFGWDIDFALDLRSGDQFVVTYQTQAQDGKTLPDGPILAAQFTNNGHVYRAVRYAGAAGAASYYTPEGRSLRKAFLRTPVEFTRISSVFNPMRRHPILNRIRAHKGVDYAAPIGTPVHASGAGHVRFVGVKGGYGNVVEIDHSRGVVTVYGHLSRFAKQLHRGQTVEQNEVIAYVGRTGLATGPHLHYEYQVNGVHQDPQKVVLPTAQPIYSTLLADFQARTAPLLRGLLLPAASVAAR